jgi:hypothetical protein
MEAMILRVPPYAGWPAVVVGDAVGDAVGVASLPQLANNDPLMTIKTIATNNILFTLGITSSFY